MMKYALMMIMAFMATVAQAAPENTATNKKAQDMNFEDLLVSGQYHFSDEAVTTVEEDKVLNSLIGVRADFKDRMKQSATLGEVKNK
ncbi:MAG: hypothetical protein KUL82_00995 [Bdellovibrio sp.]|uniref:hypothetical protein n=1 Tax=Bdellovibrio sp. TaxID=28201 RepID=UPI0039E555D4|nr:hypothetical protein [Bdellovibrio sp.]